MSLKLGEPTCGRYFDFQVASRPRQESPLVTNLLFGVVVALTAAIVWAAAAYNNPVYHGRRMVPIVANSAAGFDFYASKVQPHCSAPLKTIGEEIRRLNPGKRSTDLHSPGSLIIPRSCSTSMIGWAERNF